MKCNVPIKERTNSKYEGVTGFKGLGVRDLTYKTGFLACSVQPKHTRWGQANIRGEEGFSFNDGPHTYGLSNNR